MNPFKPTAVSSSDVSTLVEALTSQDHRIAKSLAIVMRRRLKSVMTKRTLSVKQAPKFVKNNTFVTSKKRTVRLDDARKKLLYPDLVPNSYIPSQETERDIVTANTHFVRSFKAQSYNVTIEGNWILWRDPSNEVLFTKELNKKLALNMNELTLLATKRDTQQAGMSELSSYVTTAVSKMVNGAETLLVTNIVLQSFLVLTSVMNIINNLREKSWFMLATNVTGLIVSCISVFTNVKTYTTFKANEELISQLAVSLAGNLINGMIGDTIPKEEKKLFLTAFETFAGVDMMHLFVPPKDIPKKDRFVHNLMDEVFSAMKADKQPSMATNTLMHYDNKRETPYDTPGFAFSQQYYDEHEEMYQNTRLDTEREYGSTCRCCKKSFEMYNGEDGILAHKEECLKKWAEACTARDTICFTTMQDWEGKQVDPSTTDSYSLICVKCDIGWRPQNSAAFKLHREYCNNKSIDLRKHLYINYQRCGKCHAAFGNATTYKRHIDQCSVGDEQHALSTKTIINACIRAVAIGVSITCAVTGWKIDRQIISNWQLSKAIKENVKDATEFASSIAMEAFGYALTEEVTMLADIDLCIQECLDHQVRGQEWYLEEQRRVFELNNLYTRITELKKVRTEKDSPVYTRLMSLEPHIILMGKKLKELDTTMATKGIRPVTMAYNIFGRLAAGKSHFIQNWLIPQICAGMGWEADDYNKINFTDSFWPVLSGANIYFHDEWLASVKDDDKMQEAFNEICSNGYVNLAGAFAKTQPCTAKALILGSNRCRMSVGKRLSTAATEAMWSRIKVIKYVNVDQEELAKGRVIKNKNGQDVRDVKNAKKVEDGTLTREEVPHKADYSNIKFYLCSQITYQNDSDGKVGHAEEIAKEKLVEMIVADLKQQRDVHAKCLAEMNERRVYTKTASACKGVEFPPGGEKILEDGPNSENAAAVYEDLCRMNQLRITTTRSNLVNKMNSDIDSDERTASAKYRNYSGEIVKAAATEDAMFMKIGIALSNMGSSLCVHELSGSGGNVTSRTKYGNKVKHVCVEKYTNDKGKLVMHYNGVMQQQAKFSTLSSIDVSETEKFVINIHGGTGYGKSHMARKLVAKLGKYLDTTVLEYNGKPTEADYNEASSYTRPIVVLMDDVNSYPDEYVKLFNALPTHSLIVSTSNMRTTPEGMPMSEKLKRNVGKMLSYTWFSSNKIATTLINYAQKPYLEPNEISFLQPLTEAPEGYLRRVGLPGVSVLNINGNRLEVENQEWRGRAYSAVAFSTFRDLNDREITPTDIERDVWDAYTHYMRRTNQIVFVNNKDLYDSLAHNECDVLVQADCIDTLDDMLSSKSKIMSAFLNPTDRRKVAISKHLLTSARVNFDPTLFLKKRKIHNEDDARFFLQKSYTVLRRDNIEFTCRVSAGSVHGICKNNFIYYYMTEENTENWDIEHTVTENSIKFESPVLGSFSLTPLDVYKLLDSKTNNHALVEQYALPMQLITYIRGIKEELMVTPTILRAHNIIERNKAVQAMATNYAVGQRTFAETLLSDKTLRIVLITLGVLASCAALVMVIGVLKAAFKSSKVWEPSEDVEMDGGGADAEEDAEEPPDTVETEENEVNVKDKAKQQSSSVSSRSSNGSVKTNGSQANSSVVTDNKKNKNNKARDSADFKAKMSAARLSSWFTRNGVDTLDGVTPVKATQTTNIMRKAAKNACRVINERNEMLMGTFIKGKYILAPYHITVRDKDARYRIMCDEVKLPKKYWQAKVVAVSSVNELALLEVEDKQCPPYPDITKLFVSRKNVDSTYEVVLQKLEGSGTTRYWEGVCSVRHHTEEMPYQVAGTTPTVVTGTTIAVTLLDVKGTATSGGDCGSLYYRRNDPFNAPIVAMHISTGVAASTVACVITSEMIDAALMAAARVGTEQQQQTEPEDRTVQLWNLEEITTQNGPYKPEGEVLIHAPMKKIIEKAVAPNPDYLPEPIWKSKNIQLVGFCVGAKACHKRVNKRMRTPWSNMMKTKRHCTVSMLNNKDATEIPEVLQNSLGNPSLMWTQMNKISREFEMTPEKKTILNLAQRYVSTEYRALYAGNHRMLKTSEAINGIYKPTDPYNGHLAQLEMDSSPGWLATQLFNETDKNNIFESLPLQDGQKMHFKFKASQSGSFFSTFYESAVAEACQGRRTLSVTKNSLKDCLMPIEKAKAGKTRTFQAGCVKNVMLERTFLGTILASVKKNRDKGHCQVGCDPTVDFTKIAHRIKAKNTRVLPADYSSYDKTLLSDYIKRSFEVYADVVKDCYDPNDSRLIAHLNGISTVCDDVRNPFAINEGYFYFQCQGSPSGSAMTTVLNSTVQDIAWYSVIIDILRKNRLPYTYEFITENFDWVTNGDDCIWTVRPEYEQYFPSKVVEEAMLRLANLTMTCPDKDGSVSFVPLDDTSFLSRSMRVYAGTAIVCPTLKEDSLSNYLHWTSNMTREQVSSNLRTLIFEMMFVQDKQQYNMLAKDIRTIFEDPRSMNLDSKLIVIPTYEDAMREGHKHSAGLECHIVDTQDDCFM